MSVRISREAFEALRAEPLHTDPAICFAQTSSWAVWGVPTPGDPGIGWSRDTSILTYESLRPHIHADAVFVALNDGGAARRSALPPWHMFHSGKRDFMLARAIAGTWLSGAYMTDFYKGMETATGADLESVLDALGREERERTELAMADQIDDELKMLGARDPLLIALGAAAYEVVVRHFADDFRIARLTHYSSQSLNSDEYRAEVEALVAAHPDPAAADQVS